MQRWPAHENLASQHAVAVATGVAQGDLHLKSGLCCAGTQQLSMGHMQGLLLLQSDECKPCRVCPCQVHWASMKSVLGMGISQLHHWCRVQGMAAT